MQICLERVSEGLQKICNFRSVWRFFFLGVPFGRKLEGALDSECTLYSPNWMSLRELLQFSVDSLIAEDKQQGL